MVTWQGYSNILVHGNGRACLADFGLSTVLMEFVGASYLTDAIEGNVRWAAAELFEADPPLSLSFECDIYSFGSIILQVSSLDFQVKNLVDIVSALGANLQDTLLRSED
ncbi:hypothetical protein AZE42_09025 [Rhizopogon vesiculosus]|uniref:Protein kinase domain-containing protein n=1 Tax=Rhizopogon vesiculosus TaxID=180088 RepID=A0A1J8QB82_9AGAM|nr:hypothetical protein AZE42_09025 [Rhizopogon vesiculosus]